MGYFQDTRVCQEHGFVLTPEGTCLRCIGEGERAAKWRTLGKWATGVVFVGAALTGITVARARLNTADATSAVPPVVATAAAETAPAAPPPAAVAPSDPTPRASVDWDQAMARAEQQRVQAAAAQAAAEKQREIAATTMPDPPVETYTTQRQEAAERADPAFAQTGRPRTYYRTGTNRGGAAGGAINSPSAWGLPANNGGNFRNRTGGH